jgi:hypothetical protein
MTASISPIVLSGRAAAPLSSAPLLSEGLKKYGSEISRYLIPGKDTYIGIMLTGYNNKWDMNAVNTSKISVLQADTILQISNHEINQWNHYGGWASIARWDFHT